MVFSSPIFLFVFLPLCLGLYLLSPRMLRNALLLTLSLFFYAWGEQGYVLVLLGSIVCNYGFGRWVEGRQERRSGKWVVGAAVVFNLGLLAVFKYANFFVDNFNVLLARLHYVPWHLEPIHLPLGISFFTFHALSYVMDVYRRQVRALRSVVDFALYIAFFPQSIAGPIVRYHDVAEQLQGRVHSEEGFAHGARQFILGLAKKMLLANTLAVPADAIFGLPSSALTCGLAWLGAACYTLQIYFDFSGYSDMAIGLARLFGFAFRPNFHYPYIASSVTEFWRRWHISLSSWFRDYLYIPLGGNRGGRARTYANLVTVFLLCGLWHGASWTFIAWGLYHGTFLVLERLGLQRRLERLPALLQHAYTLGVVVIGWVLFRAKSFAAAAGMLGAMVGLADGSAVEYLPAAFLRGDVMVALLAGALLCLPILPALAQLQASLRRACPRQASTVDAIASAWTVAGLAVLALGCAMLLAGGTHNPFIYFNF